MILSIEKVSKQTEAKQRYFFEQVSKMANSLPTAIWQMIGHALLSTSFNTLYSHMSGWCNGWCNGTVLISQTSGVQT